MKPSGPSDGQPSRPPNRMWLGQCQNTPFEDARLRSGTSSYSGNSSDKSWPVYKYSKAHRLHDIKTLCSVCEEVDISSLAQGGGTSVILRNSFHDIVRTASHCRLCSLVAQSGRGHRSAAHPEGFLYTMGNQDAVDDGPVRLDLEDGKIHIRIPHPGHWPIHTSNTDVPYPDFWHLDSFGVAFEEDFGMLTEEAADTSVPCKTTDALVTSASPGYMVERLRGEIHQLLKTAACGECLGRAWPRMRNTTACEATPTLPDRVVEILGTPGSEALRLRLYETKGTQAGHYIALSHRWGGKLTLTTTKDTLPERLKGMNLNDLPRTFRDAVLVARSMEISYIWIDSLCIVQDDQKEWLQQSKKMGAIYRDASFTIAAHSAGQCDEGFLWRYQVPSGLRIAPGRGGPHFVVRLSDLDPDQLDRMLFESVIARRAWILQELTLSRRILHFVENRLLWECEHQSPEVRGEQMETTSVIFQKAMATSSIHTAWLELVQRYSDYHITMQNDKLIALGGIVSVLQGMATTADHQRYHCGVFEADMTRSLLWYKAEGPSERYHERAPSWSWGSVNGRCHFLPLETSEMTTTLISIQGQRHEDYTDPAITQASCLLVVKAPVMRVTAGITVEKKKRLKTTPPNGPRKMLAVFKDFGERTTYGWCIQDEPGVFGDAVGYLWPGEPGPVVFLAVGGRVVDDMLAGAWCLAIRPVDGGRGVYRRIGLAYVRDVELLASALAKPEELTLA